MNPALLGELFAIIAPVVICAAVGYGWARSPLDYPADFVRRLVMWIGTPSLILATLDQVEIPSALLLQTGAAAVTVVAITTVGFGLLLRGMRFDRAVFLPPMVFPNCGNMGLPIALFAFGDAGLALALAFFVAMTLMHFTVGLVISVGMRNISQVLRTPIVWAALLAVGLHLADLSLPRFTINTLSLLGGLTIPLMLITLGVSLASIRVHGMGHALYLSVLRLLGGAAAGWLVAFAFGLEGIAQSVVILQSAMPAAVLNYMLALQHGKAAREVAGIVVISTLLSFLTLPLLLAWLL